MFNQADYEKRAGDRRVQILAAEDQSWRLTVDQRYALFIATNAATKTAAIVKALSQEPHTTDLRKFRDYYGNELMQNANTLHLAASVLFGVASVGDPVGCEVVMQLHAEAALVPPLPIGVTEHGDIVIGT
jgi:hypothetical protein